FSEAGLLGRALEWVGNTGARAEHALKITNREFFRRGQLWPKTPGYFRLEPGAGGNPRLGRVVAGKAPGRRASRGEEGRGPTDYADMALWPYGDFVFTPHWDIMSSTTKARQYGFNDLLDTEDTFFRMFDRLRERRIIPGPGRPAL